MIENKIYAIIPVHKKCRCTYECAMSTNVLFNLDQQKELISQTLKDFVKK